VSSSGGAVTFSVDNVVEVLMQDLDGSFAWTGSQPSNGMTRYRYSGDNHNCVVFDWAPGTHRFYDLEVIPAQRDLTDDAYLSFRACQGTQHPYTNALDAPLSFTASLTDGEGIISSIDFGVIGGVTRTYERENGWANEFCTVRLRLTDFENNGSGIDLSNIELISFDFGADFGSDRGRIGLDDVEITKE
jgi:hypothetical protein